MNDKEKVEAIKKLLSLNISSFEEYAKYVGIIHNILDEKMTMIEVDDYIRTSISNENRIIFFLVNVV